MAPATEANLAAALSGDAVMRVLSDSIDNEVETDSDESDDESGDDEADEDAIAPLLKTASCHLPTVAGMPELPAGLLHQTRSFRKIASSHKMTAVKSFEYGAGHETKGTDAADAGALASRGPGLWQQLRVATVVNRLHRKHKPSTAEVVLTRPKLTASFGLTATEVGVKQRAPCLRIDKLVDGGPAERGGCNVGDKIIAVDGMRIKTIRALLAAVQGKQRIQLSISRRGRFLTDFSGAWLLWADDGNGQAIQERLSADDSSTVALGKWAKKQWQQARGTGVAQPNVMLVFQRGDLFCLKAYHKDDEAMAHVHTHKCVIDSEEPVPLLVLGEAMLGLTEWTGDMHVIRTTTKRLSDDKPGQASSPPHSR